MHKTIVKLFVLILITLSACKPANRWNPDVSKISANVKLIRFEKQLFSIDTNHFDAGAQKLIETEKDMMELFVSRLHHFGKMTDPRSMMLLKKVIVTNKYMRDSLYPDVEKTFDDAEIAKLETQLTDAFKHLQYYYPKDTLPKVYTFINPWDVPAATYPNVLAIGLDMFMGENYKYYPSLEYPGYLRKRLRKEYIVSEALKTMFQAKYDIQQSIVDQTMLSNMIYAGKRLFYLDVMKPDMPDSIKIGYTAAQLKWCQDYEADIWNHMVAKNLLYNTNQDKVDRYISENAFTNDEDVPQESSPRIGEWLGWQIVKKYMEENPKVTLDELFQNKDYRKILAASKYKPGK